MIVLTEGDDMSHGPLDDEVLRRDRIASVFSRIRWLMQWGVIGGMVSFALAVLASPLFEFAAEIPVGLLIFSGACFVSAAVGLVAWVLLLALGCARFSLRSLMEFVLLLGLGVSLIVACGEPWKTLGLYAITGAFAVCILRLQRFEP